MVPREKDYHCENCDRSSIFPTVSFKVEVEVVDSTGTAGFTMFEREVEKLLHVSATGLLSQNNGDMKEVPQRLNDLCGQKLIFQIRISDKQFKNGWERFTVTKIFNPDNEPDQQKGKEINRGSDYKRLKRMQDLPGPSSQDKEKNKASDSTQPNDDDSGEKPTGENNAY
ncbi:hypothetical protein HS088_TW19G00349 [Tripterygium wilfordii]|uniref:Replication factor A C-terminal domain-containing protein n=1 Tax=Tripterygium wilfordii TaxID=458696 RepID=A0A7J7C9E0_TRIWF|nr:replication protein A 70 kDa DNA-binding subunit D-like [Tripterygium wilfordii]KAF5730753.1 hypothetical protein HS088_TW19G00349 [Tripterygium wilfordii]